MKQNSSYVTIGLLALCGYLLYKYNASTPNSTDAGFNSDYGMVTTTSPTGKLQTTKVTTVKQGVELINDAIVNGSQILPTGQTLVGSNRTFSDQSGNTYRTGSNQTVQQLAGSSSPKVITVTPVKSGTSFFDKPIKNIPGIGNTRNY